MNEKPFSVSIFVKKDGTILKAKTVKRKVKKGWHKIIIGK